MIFADRRWANSVRSVLRHSGRSPSVFAVGSRHLGDDRDVPVKTEPSAASAQWLTSTPSPSRRQLSPRLSYGRHRGPSRKGCRHAAVVITVYPHRADGEACFALTRRPLTLSHHAGQICLPGGRVEDGEHAIEAAKREYLEELGVPLADSEWIGELPPIYVYASDNLVDTHVMLQRVPLPAWNADPVEVDEIIEVPLKSISALGAALARRKVPSSVIPVKSVRRGKVRDGSGVFQYRFSYPAIELVDHSGRPHQVWGATAMLLAQWSEVVYRVNEKAD